VLITPFLLVRQHLTGYSRFLLVRKHLTGYSRSGTVFLEAATLEFTAGETAATLEVDRIVSSTPRETIPLALRGDTNAGMIAPKSTAARMPESTSLNVFILVG
jgi:hypothetical protein